MKEELKFCIWCKKDETSNSFNTLAHTIPKSLGGKKICKNVCDECNKYFGNYQENTPSIETIIKETFNISRYIFIISQKNQIGKNKKIPRYSSTYFNISKTKNTLTLKQSYKLQPKFQEKIGFQMRR